MGVKFANNGSSTLAGAITAAATSIVVASGDGTKFPTLSAGDYFYATLVKVVSGVTSLEIIKVTARTSDTLTATRGQDGTTALAFSAGDRIELRLNKAALDEFAINGTAMRATNFIDKATTNATATGTVTLNCSTADVFDLTLTGNTTLALSNLPTLSGEEFTFVVRVTQGATAYSLTWFGSLTWLTSGGTAPAAPAANKTIEYVISTKNGTSFTGRKGAAN